MNRKFAGSTLIGISSVMFAAGLVMIVLAWIYNEPLTQRILDKLTEVDSDLMQVETTLTTSKTELERTLRILDTTEKTINKFTSNDPKAFFENVQSTLGDGLVPELETARERLVSARDTLEQLRVTIFGLNALPFVNISIPDKTLTDLIDSADALQAQITDVTELAQQASTLLADASYLLSGDFTDTRSSLEFFLSEIDTYQAKVADWRWQADDFIKSTPKWIDNTSIGLTFFMLWFCFSQLGLLLHGINLKRGNSPLEMLRKD